MLIFLYVFNIGYYAFTLNITLAVYKILVQIVVIRNHVLVTNRRTDRHNGDIMLDTYKIVIF